MRVLMSLSKMIGFARSLVAPLLFRPVLHLPDMLEYVPGDPASGAARRSVRWDAGDGRDRLMQFLDRSKVVDGWPPSSGRVQTGIVLNPFLTSLARDP